MSVSLYDRLLSAAPDALRNNAAAQSLSRSQSPAAQTWGDLLSAWTEQLETQKASAEERLENARIDYLLSALDRQSRTDDGVSGLSGGADSNELELFRDYAAKMRLLRPGESVPFYL